jgi:hypothetical protein
MPPHCSRDPAHGPGVGLGLLPRLPPPTCARPVSGVGLGPRCYAASLLWSPGPRPPPVFRSAICDCLSLNVSASVSVNPLCPRSWGWGVLGRERHRRVFDVSSGDVLGIECHRDVRQVRSRHRDRGLSLFCCSLFRPCSGFWWCVFC